MAETTTKSMRPQDVANREHGDNVRRGILAFIRGHVRDYGYPPSLREIGDGMGLRSNGTVYYHLEQLERDGLIKRGGEGRNRAIALVEAEPSCCPHCGGALTPEAADV